MLLSEAMKLGAMMKPQGFGWFLKDGKSCALGAAMEAVGVSIAEGDRYDPSVELWTWLIKPRPCPACPEFGHWSSTGAVIAHLNDDHLWTREAIAAWIEVLERSDEPATVDAVLECSGEPVLTTRV